MKEVKAAADWAVCFSPIVCLSGDNLLLHTSCSKRKYGFLICFRHKEINEIRIRVVHAFSLQRINTTEWNQELTGSGTISPRAKCSLRFYSLCTACDGVLLAPHHVWCCEGSFCGDLLHRRWRPLWRAGVIDQDHLGGSFTVFVMHRFHAYGKKIRRLCLLYPVSLMCSMLADAPSCGCCINSRSLVSKLFRVNSFIRFQAGCYTSIGARNPIKRTRTHHPL